MVLEGPGVVFSATLGAIQALGVLFDERTEGYVKFILCYTPLTK